MKIVVIMRSLLLDFDGRNHERRNSPEPVYSADGIQETIRALKNNKYWSFHKAAIALTCQTQLYKLACLDERCVPQLMSRNKFCRQLKRRLEPSGSRV
jgi:hypothetical protein